MNQVDNSKLEELIKDDLTVEMQNVFFEIFKESQLFMPVTFSQNLYEGIENAKVGGIFEAESGTGFNINYLTDYDGNNVIPLFTSSEVMEATGLKSSAIVIFMSDLADLLSQTDKYSIIAINPFTEYDLNIPVEVFLDLFNENDDVQNPLKVILKILKEKSVELDDDYSFYLSSDDDFMKDESVEGIFRPKIPFNVSSRQGFQDELKYLNILIMPKTKRILFIGNVVDEDHFDTIIAPESEFHHVEDLDEVTRLWTCGNQPFYDE